MAPKHHKDQLTVGTLTRVRSESHHQVSIDERPFLSGPIDTEVAPTDACSTPFALSFAFVSFCAPFNLAPTAAFELLTLPDGRDLLEALGPRSTAMGTRALSHDGVSDTSSFATVGAHQEIPLKV